MSHDTNYGILSGVIVVLLVIVLSACGDGKGSTNIDRENTGPASVIEMPRGFRNVAHKCAGGGLPIRVFSASRGNDAESNVGGAVAAVADMSCGK